MVQILILQYICAQLVIIAQLGVPSHSSAFQVHPALPPVLQHVLRALQAHIAPLQDSRLRWHAQPLENVQQLALCNQECVSLVRAPMEQEHVLHAQLENTVGQSLARTVLHLLPATHSMSASLVQRAGLRIPVTCAQFSQLVVTFWPTMVLHIQVSERKPPAAMYHV